MVALLSLFQALFANIDCLVPAMWVALGCGVAWFLLSARKHQAITTKEAEMLWKSHKQFKHCSAETFTTLSKRNKIIGYICQCGHEHKQERPLVNIRN
jgi:hypothetical protein